MASIADRLLAGPTWRGFFLAAGLTLLFLGGAALVYYNRGDGKPFFDYWVKVADSLINGALVTFLFGTLKVVIGVGDKFFKFLSPAPQE